MFCRTRNLLREYLPLFSDGELFRVDDEHCCGDLLRPWLETCYKRLSEGFSGLQDDTYAVPQDQMQ